MKTLIMIGILFCFSMQSFAQQQLNDDPFFYSAKMERYAKMKRTGTTLTFAGSALFLFGIMTLVNSSSAQNNNGYNSTSSNTNGNLVGGAVSYLAGIGCLGAGIPLWIVGGINKGRYERKLDAVSVGFRVNPQGAGLTLKYRF